MSNEIKIYALRVPESGGCDRKLPYKGYVTEMDVDSIENIKAFVGGYAEEDTFAPGLVIISNEDGKRLKLQPNRALVHNGTVIDYFVGNIFVCRKENSKMENILEEDVAFIEEHLVPIVAMNGGNIFVTSSDDLSEYKEEKENR